MNFEKLPRSLVESILAKSNIETIAKLSQTCSTVNKLIKKKQLDKIDVGRISFAIRDEYEVLVFIDDCPKFSAEKQVNGFDQSYVITGAQSAEDLQKLIQGKIRQVLISVKSVEHIDFGCFSINDSFVQMLREIPIQWTDVCADFVMCNYSMPKSDCLTLWKMFKLVDVNEGRFLEADIDVINDEMMVKTLPSITFTTDRFEVTEYQENPNITDRTLEFLAENRPPIFVMGKFVCNFTVDGILRLLNNVVHSRDSTVEEWFIGAVRFDFPEFRQLFDGLQELETDYSTVMACEEDGTYEIMVSYKKLNSEETTCICVNLIKPEEVFEDARIEDMPDFVDSDMEEDEDIDGEFNNNNNNNDMEF